MENQLTYIKMTEKPLLALRLTRKIELKGKQAK